MCGYVVDQATAGNVSLPAFYAFELAEAQPLCELRASRVYLEVTPG
ncbi:MAG: hypothetical protein ABR924_03135 [Terracidiphilus sp.]